MNPFRSRLLALLADRPLRMLDRLNRPDVRTDALISHCRYCPPDSGGLTNTENWRAQSTAEGAGGLTRQLVLRDEVHEPAAQAHAGCHRIAEPIGWCDPDERQDR